MVRIVSSKINKGVVPNRGTLHFLWIAYYYTSLSGEKKYNFQVDIT